MSKCAKVYEDELEMTNLKRLFRKCWWSKPLGHCWHVGLYIITFDEVNKCCGCPKVLGWSVERILERRNQVKDK
jgi:hypothetical protein